MSLPPIRQKRRYPKKAILDPEQAKALALMNNTVRPVELLDQVYAIMKRDIDRLDTIGTLTDSQAKQLHSHARVLIDASKEQRLVEAEALAKAKKMSDNELVEALKALPKETLHKILTLLAQEKDSGS